MDDLEEIWGPRGRATLDPASVRPSPPAAASPAPPASPYAPAAVPTPGAPALGPAFAGSEPGAIFRASPSGRPRVLWIAAGAAALLSAVLVVLVATRSPAVPPPLTPSAAGTATTIVSAAADLLGRGTTTTTTEPAGSTDSAASATGSTAAAPVPAAEAPRAPAPARPPVASSPATAAAPPSLTLAEQAAHQFVDVITRRDCDGLWSLLSRGTREFLVGSDEPGERSGRDALCDGLRGGDEIPPMRVHGPAEARGERAVVPLESGGQVEPLTFVAEDGRWVIDLIGDFSDQS